MRTVGLKRARAWVFGSLLLAAALAGTFGAATQYITRQLGYHPALGAPLAGRLYAPWRWFAWQGTWYANAPDAFNRAWIGVLGGVGLSSICYVIGCALERCTR